VQAKKISYYMSRFDAEFVQGKNQKADGDDVGEAHTATGAKRKRQDTDS
jgi:hypothetical protein